MSIFSLKKYQYNSHQTLTDGTDNLMSATYIYW